MRKIPNTVSKLPTAPTSYSLCVSWRVSVPTCWTRWRKLKPSSSLHCTLSVHHLKPAKKTCHGPPTKRSGLCTSQKSAPSCLTVPATAVTPCWARKPTPCVLLRRWLVTRVGWRSEEHTSELQSRGHLVCRLLRE